MPTDSRFKIASTPGELPTGWKFADAPSTRFKVYSPEQARQAIDAETIHTVPLPPEGVPEPPEMVVSEPVPSTPERKRPIGASGKFAPEHGILEESERQIRGGLADVAGGVGVGLEIAGQGIGSLAKPGIAPRPLVPVLQRAASAVSSIGKETADYWAKKSQRYVQSESIQGNIIDSPELLVNPKWWASNISRMSPSLGAAIITGIATGGSGIPAVVAGGAAGGLMEGAGTRQTALGRGMTEEQAVDKAAKFAAISGILNAISLNKLLNPAARSALSRFLITGSTEALTEASEEPAEGVLFGEDWNQMVERLKSAASVAPIAGLTGGAASIMMPGPAQAPERKQPNTRTIRFRSPAEQQARILNAKNMIARWRTRLNEIQNPPLSPAEQSAQVFEREFGAEEQLRQSPRGADLLRQQLAQQEQVSDVLREQTRQRNITEELARLWENIQNKPLPAPEPGISPAEQSAQVFEREFGAEEQLRQSPRGADLLRQQLAQQEQVSDVLREQTRQRNITEELARLWENIQNKPLPAPEPGISPAEQSAIVLEQAIGRAEQLNRSMIGMEGLKRRLAQEELDSILESIDNIGKILRLTPPKNDSGDGGGGLPIANAPKPKVTPPKPGQKPVIPKKNEFGLTPDQTAYIEKQVTDAGSLSAVQAQITNKNNPTSKYALDYARRLYGTAPTMPQGEIVQPTPAGDAVAPAATPASVPEHRIGKVKQNNKTYQVWRLPDGSLELRYNYRGQQERMAYDEESYNQYLARKADRKPAQASKYRYLSRQRIEDDYHPWLSMLLGSGTKLPGGGEWGELKDLFDGIMIAGRGRPYNPNEFADRDAIVERGIQYLESIGEISTKDLLPVDYANILTIDDILARAGMDLQDIYENPRKTPAEYEAERRMSPEERQIREHFEFIQREIPDITEDEFSRIFESGNATYQADIEQIRRERGEAGIQQADEEISALEGDTATPDFLADDSEVDDATWADARRAEGWTEDEISEALNQANADLEETPPQETKTPEKKSAKDTFEYYEAQKESSYQENIKLAGDSQVVRMESPGENFYYIIHKSTKQNGVWQVTTFHKELGNEKDVPTADTTFKTRDEAIASISGKFTPAPPLGWTDWRVTKTESATAKKPTQQESTPHAKPRIAGELTTSPFEMTDSRTGDIIPANEEHYYLPDTKETVSKSTYANINQVDTTGEVFKDGEVKKTEKQLYEMTGAEYEAFYAKKHRDAIEAWNKAGSKGFPPSSGKHTIPEVTKYAEEVGYVLPRDADTVLSIPVHKLIVEAAIRQNKKVPARVIAEYPDLKKKYFPDKPAESDLNKEDKQSSMMDGEEGLTGQRDMFEKPSPKQPPKPSEKPGQQYSRNVRQNVNRKIYHELLLIEKENYTKGEGIPDSIEDELRGVADGITDNIEQEYLSKNQAGALWLDKKLKDPAWVDEQYAIGKRIFEAKPKTPIFITKINKGDDPQRVMSEYRPRAGYTIRNMQTGMERKGLYYMPNDDIRYSATPSHQLTTAMFDITDSRTGKTIPAGEEHVYLPGTGETLSKDTFASLYSRQEQGNLFAPGSIAEVKPGAKTNTSVRQTPKDIMDTGYSVKEESQTDIFDALTGQGDLFTFIKAKSDAIPGSPASTVSTWLSTVKDSFTVPVSVVDSITNLPAGMAARIGRDANASGKRIGGIYYNGKVYLIAENIASKEQAVKILFHEVAGHDGLRKVMGADFDAFLNELANRSEFSKEIKALQQERGYEDASYAADEWFAEQAQQGNIKPSLWGRFMFYLRKFLRRLGVDVKFGKAELEALIGRAYQATSRIAPARSAQADPRYFVEQGYNPKKTVKAYKLFRVDARYPGKLFPLFVDANSPIETGVWLQAESGEMVNGKVKSKLGPLSYRPGWHAGDLPLATHIGGKSSNNLAAPDMRPDNQVWAEVELAADVDWQTEANKRGVNAQGKLIASKAAIADQVPTDGYYRYKTNPNMTGNWLIGGSMKVNRILTDAEVEAINSKAGTKDLPRKTPFDSKKYGFDATPRYSATDQTETPEFKRWFGDSKVVDENGMPKVMYHGTDADFNVFGRGIPWEAFWFTNNPRVADLFGSEKSSRRSVMPVYVSIKNPYVVNDIQKDRVDVVELKGAGYDGLKAGEWYAAFSPTQIKSAYNTGTFDPSNPDIRYSAESRGSVPQSVYTEAVKKGKVRGGRIYRKDTRGHMLARVMVPFSTRLGAISPKIKAAFRTYRFRLNKAIIDDTTAVKPLMDATKRMTTDDQIIFDLARKNGDAKALQRLIKKYGIYKEYSALRKTLDDIRDRALAAGYDLGYQEHYHPRVIKDASGFLNHLYGTSAWSHIEEAFRVAQDKQSVPLTDTQKAQIANTIIRGYGPKRINLSKPGNLEDRSVNLVDAELNKFYFDSNEALLIYITNVNKAVESRRFFGIKVDQKRRDPSREELDLYQKMREDPMLDFDMRKSIGDYVAKLMKDSKLKPEQESELVGLFQDFFNYQSTTGVLDIFKNMGYITTMGHVFSTITQFGDFAWAVYEAGVYRTAKAAAKSIAGKSDITRKDIGIERIAEEFTNPTMLGHALEGIFKATGFAQIDRLGKETLINAMVDKLRGMAQKNDPRLKMLLDRFLPENISVDEVIADLKSGAVTDNVKLVAFNELLEWQPGDLGEMPQTYIAHPGGRVFYMLKTFTIKQFDAFRREAFSKIGEGKVKEGLANLAKLSAIFVLCNATADEIKDWLAGRDRSMSDRVIDNLLRLVGFSRYLTWQLRTQDVSTTLFETVAPPTNLIDTPVRDTRSILNAYRNNKAVETGEKRGEAEDINFWKLESMRYVPVIGGNFYWWFGGGKDKNLKARYTQPIEDAKKRLLTPEELAEFRKTLDAEVEAGRLTPRQRVSRIQTMNRNQRDLRLKIKKQERAGK